MSSNERGGKHNPPSGKISQNLSEAEEELFAEWAEEEERLKASTPPEKASSAQLASDLLEEEEEQHEEEEGSSDLESKTNVNNNNNNNIGNHVRSKKKRKVDHLNVDTSIAAADTSSADAQASLDLPITPTYTGVNLPSVEPEIKEEYVKKDEYDKLINSHTETIKKLKNDYKLMADKYKKEM